jgi:hypothetical protein
MRYQSARSFAADIVAPDHSHIKPVDIAHRGEKLNSEALNRWITVGANVGVLIGILLLVFELNQNRELTRAQIRNELSQGVIEFTMAQAENEQLADIILRAESGGDLTPVEQRRYTYFFRGFIRYIANVHYQYRLGLYDDSEYIVQRDAWAQYLSSSQPLAHVWCEYRMTVSVEVRAEIDNLLTTYTC